MDRVYSSPVCLRYCFLASKSELCTLRRCVIAGLCHSTLLSLASSHPLQRRATRARRYAADMAKITMIDSASQYPVLPIIPASRSSQRPHREHAALYCDSNNTSVITRITAGMTLTAPAGHTHEQGQHKQGQFHSPVMQSFEKTPKNPILSDSARSQSTNPREFSGWSLCVVDSLVPPMRISAILVSRQ